MLPLLRVLPLGSVFLSALIFLLAATPPRRPALPDALGPARGPLIDADEHPEWRQFYVQAAFKRAGEIEHLRDLPNTPTRTPVVEQPDAQKAAIQPAPAKEIAAAVAPAAPAPEESSDASAIAAKEITPTQEALPSADVAAPVAPVVVAEPAGPPLPPVRPLVGLPSEPETAESDDITGALDNPAIAVTMPIAIGETSSTELPLVMPPESTAPLPVPRPKAGARAKTPHTLGPRTGKRPVRAAKRPAAPAAKQQAQAQTNSFRSLFGER
jgi:hypothetical protein